MTSSGALHGTIDRLELHDLGSRLVAGVAEMSSFMAWWLAMLAEFDRREGWAGDGAKSCSQWLSWKCGIDGRTARAHVRVAAQLADLPRVRTVFGEGRLSYSKVRAICRVATTENEAFLVDLAMDLTATQLDRAVAGYERTHGAPLTLEADAERRAKCDVRTWYDEEGLHHTEVVSPPEDGALIDLAVEYGRDRLYEDTGQAAAGPSGRLDALVWVLRRGLVNAGRPGLDDESPYLLVVHVKEARSMVTDDGRVDIGGGVCVHPRTLQRFGCESMVQAMLEGLDGSPLDLGRTVRTATRKQRRALQAMYERCEFPGCDVSVDYCEFHHLDWWSKGGRSDLHVFRPLCRRHHHLCHEGGWRLVVRADGKIDAMPPIDVGGVVVNAPVLTVESVPALAMVASNRRRALAPVDEALDSIGGRWAGERMDRWALGAIVDNLVAATSSTSVSRTDVDPSLMRGSPPSLN